MDPVHTSRQPDECTDADEALRIGLHKIGVKARTTEVLKAIKKIDKEYVFPQRTLGRWLSLGVPNQAKGHSQDHMQMLGKVLATGEPAWAIRFEELCDERWTKEPTPSSVSSTPTRRSEMPRKWYGVIPSQDTREYASIDEVYIVSMDEEQISGTMQRLSPPEERNLRWGFSGTYDGSEALFLNFFPLTTHNRRSRGVIALARFDYRSENDDRYDGHYSRQPDLHRGLLTREYHWHQRVPGSAMHDVALLDLDNTLREDWSLRSWLEFLSKKTGWSQAARCYEETEDLIREYQNGGFTHDVLVEQCEALYAQLFKGRSQREVGDHAAVYIDSTSRRAIHNYVTPLLEELRHRWIAPVIVSGAPYELVSRYAAWLGIEESFGLKLRTEDGIYDGEVLDNPGGSHRKEEIVQEIASRRRKIVLAVGDSESDTPLWDASPNRIVVGPRRATQWMPTRAFRLNPASTSWAKIEAWLDDALPREYVSENDDNDD